MKQQKFHKHLPIIFIGLFIFFQITMFFPFEGLPHCILKVVFATILLLCYFSALDADAEIKADEKIGELEGYLKELNKISKDAKKEGVKNNIKYIFHTVKNIPSIIPYLIAHDKILSKDVYQARVELLPKIEERKYKKYLKERRTKTIIK